MKNFSLMDDKLIYDIIVIGAGPAGISSAIYGIRKGLKVGFIGDIVGGQVLTTAEIENIIGTSSTTGPDFSKSLEEHAKQYEIPFYNGHLVTKIIDSEIKTIITDDNKEFKTRSIIIATGATHKKLNVVGETEFTGRGVHYCSTCDGPFYRNLDVLVVGGGNSGVEAAIDLSNIAKSVTLIEYDDKLKADSILISKLDKVNVITGAAIKEIKGEQFVTNIDYLDKKTGELKNIKADGVFIEIGLKANTAVFKDLIQLDNYGQIIIDNLNRTNIEGIFAAGDCTDVAYKQIIISMGEGAKAALSAYDYIIKKTRD